MSKRSVITVTLIGLLFSFTFPSLAQDSSNKLSRLEQFLQERIPYLTGTIAYQEEGSYFARIRGNKSEGPVTIFRNVPRQTDSGKRLAEKTVGTGQIRTHEPGVGRLILSSSVQEKVQLGDMVRLSRIKLSVRNRSEISRRRIKRIVDNHPGLERTTFVEPGKVPESPFLLTITPDRLMITKTNTNDILAETSFQTEVTPTKSTPKATSLRDVDNFYRTVNDFEWISLPSRERIDLLMLGAPQAVGFARFNSEVKSVKWKDVTGDVLDVSLVGTMKEKPGKLFVIIVTKFNNSIRTKALTFDLLEGTLNQRWTAKDVWIRRTGDDQFYAQKIGINSPFSSSHGYVTVTREGWDWTDKSLEDLPSTLIPPAFVSEGGNFAFLEPSGALNVLRRNQPAIKTPLQFGGSPRSVRATRNRKSRSLHPEFAMKETSGTIKIFLPKNIASGVTFIQGFKSYKQSRLTLLEINGQSTDTLWESARLSGYVSSTEWGNGSFWSMMVNPESGRSQLKRLAVSR